MEKIWSLFHEYTHKELYLMSWSHVSHSSEGLWHTSRRQGTQALGSNAKAMPADANSSRLAAFRATCHLVRCFSFFDRRTGIGFASSSGDSHQRSIRLNCHLEAFDCGFAVTIGLVLTSGTFIHGSGFGGCDASWVVETYDACRQVMWLWI
ncbi:hypothetical protein CHS0354_000220 [Potamilus streckersoni]|uniref:Uncharacterized protein n=1 Tax=Potamilus streckersoni TaxID=2493646 RepID=A0AAE0SIQ9_9BIVA|nr:hypothetical protein CHS0354_000220 [Potamilus streckersoni]